MSGTERLAELIESAMYWGWTKPQDIADYLVKCGVTAPTEGTATTTTTRGPSLLSPITQGGRLYQPQTLIEEKYSISAPNLRAYRKRGLPSIKVGNFVYFNEDDFHRFFRGEIGEEDHRKTGRRKCNEVQTAEGPDALACN